VIAGPTFPTAPVRLYLLVSRRRTPCDINDSVAIIARDATSDASTASTSRSTARTCTSTCEGFTSTCPSSSQIDCSSKAGDTKILSIAKEFLRGRDFYLENLWIIIIFTLNIEIYQKWVLSKMFKTSRCWWRKIFNDWLRKDFNEIS